MLKLYGNLLERILEYLSSFAWLNSLNIMMSKHQTNVHLTADTHERTKDSSSRAIGSIESHSSKVRRVLHGTLLELLLDIHVLCQAQQ